MGLGFTTSKGQWYLNPFLGFTHGKLLSGGTRGVIGDGIVPGLFSYFNNGIIEFETFACWYKALRKEGTATFDYALYWIMPGFQVGRNVHLGLLYEGFKLTGGLGQTSESQYQTLGAYVKILAGGKYSFRFSIGHNFKKDIYSSDFYKLQLILPLL